LTYSIDGHVKFQGIRKKVNHAGLTDAAFTSIAAGESIDIDIEMASIHDLSAGGKYQIASFGRVAYATEDSNKLVGTVQYKSNTLNIEVDGDLAATVDRAVNVLAKRGELQWRSVNYNQYCVNRLPMACYECWISGPKW
jgi:deuterolysin